MMKIDFRSEVDEIPIGQWIKKFTNWIWHFVTSMMDETAMIVNWATVKYWAIQM